MPTITEIKRALKFATHETAGVETSATEADYYNKTTYDYLASDRWLFASIGVHAIRYFEDEAALHYTVRLDCRLARAFGGRIVEVVYERGLDLYTVKVYRETRDGFRIDSTNTQLFADQIHAAIYEQISESVSA